MSRAAFVVERPRSTALRALNYTPEVERFREPSRRRATRPLGSLLSSLGPAYGQVFTRIDCAPEHGVELLSQTDMFAAEPLGRVIRRDSMPDPERHLVQEWQVLIAGAGQFGDHMLFGRSIIADRRLAGKYVGPDAMVLTFKDPGSDTNLFAYAFLCTGLGVRAVHSCIYGTSIPRIRPDVLSDLLIPECAEEVRSRVAHLIREAVSARETYLAELQAARHVIEALPEVQESSELCRGRRARCVTWRGPFPTLAAWTYASTGGALELLQTAWTGRLGHVVRPNGIFNGPRFARIPVAAPYGIEFMSQRDVFSVRPALRRIKHPGVADEELFVQEGDLLVGGHGTVAEGEIFGRVVYATPRLAQNGFSQDVLRIQVRQEWRAVTYGFLSTSLGLRLLRSTGVGTKIMSMRLDLLGQIPLPDLPSSGRRAVALHVERAARARDLSMEAEGEALRIVEQEVLPAWLG
jgi:hypothetical protein